MIINNTDSAVRILLALTASPGLLVASALPGYHTARRRMSRVVGAAASSPLLRHARCPRVSTAHAAAACVARLLARNGRPARIVASPRTSTRLGVAQGDRLRPSLRWASVAKWEALPQSQSFDLRRRAGSGGDLFAAANPDASLPAPMVSPDLAEPPPRPRRPSASVSALGGHRDVGVASVASAAPCAVGRRFARRRASRRSFRRVDGFPRPRGASPSSAAPVGVRPRTRRPSRRGRRLGRVRGAARGRAVILSPPRLPTLLPPRRRLPPTSWGLPVVRGARRYPSTRSAVVATADGRRFARRRASRRSFRRVDGFPRPRGASPSSAAPVGVRPRTRRPSRRGRRLGRARSVARGRAATRPPPRPPTLRFSRRRPPTPSPRPTSCPRRTSQPRPKIWPWPASHPRRASPPRPTSWPRRGRARGRLDGTNAAIVAVAGVDLGRRGAAFTKPLSGF